MQAISPPGIRTLNPDEARALRTQRPEQSNKEAFLGAIVGTMTEEEADEMERVIDAACERIDD